MAQARRLIRIVYHDPDFQLRCTKWYAADQASEAQDLIGRLQKSGIEFQLERIDPARAKGCEPPGEL